MRGRGCRLGLKQVGFPPRQTRAPPGQVALGGRAAGGEPGRDAGAERGGGGVKEEAVLPSRPAKSASCPRGGNLSPSADTIWGGWLPESRVSSLLPSALLWPGWLFPATPACEGSFPPPPSSSAQGMPSGRCSCLGYREGMVRWGKSTWAPTRAFSWQAAGFPRAYRAPTAGTPPTENTQPG